MFTLPRLAVQPVGTYGISYDIFTRVTEDPVPNGWDAPRSATYRAIISSLRDRGFTRHQYSDYRRPNTSAVQAWLAMLGLRFIEPLGKFASTLKGIKSHYIDDMMVMDQTYAIVFGGPMSRALLGPTPRNIVVRAQEQNGAAAPLFDLDVHAPQVGAGQRWRIPPIHTRVTPASQNPNNYLVTGD
ncbi:hypothetical protein BC834DRAFT_834230 [Gloeopeniophorella convolvens]|nr:hypothetical protein BC834DRAFT_834230 [Gloeopeniophorella convolvens]